MAGLGGCAHILWRIFVLPSYFRACPQKRVGGLIICLYCIFSIAYPNCMDYSQIITMEAGKRSGKPCIRGLRVTVAMCWDILRTG